MKYLPPAFYGMKHFSHFRNQSPLLVLHALLTLAFFTVLIKVLYWCQLTTGLTYFLGYIKLHICALSGHDIF